MKRLVRAMFVLVVAAVCTSSALAGFVVERPEYSFGMPEKMARLKRVALVIGNSNYAYLAGGLKLPGALNDARAVATALRAVRFEVELIESASYVRFREALKKFAVESARADVSFIYFAGAGEQIAKRNFLYPVDMRPQTSPRELENTAIELSQLFAATSEVRGLRIFALDGGNGNAFKFSNATSASFAKDIPRSESIVVYSSGPGETAQDSIVWNPLPGIGARNRQNGPFALALIKHMTTPSTDVRQTFELVRREVHLMTEGKQTPYFVEQRSGFRFAFVYDRLAEVKSQPAPVPPKFGKRRQALVIGNTSYLGQSSLPNAQKDAAAVARRLSQLGFELIEGKPQVDLKRTELARSLQQLSLVPKDVGLVAVYFSGHGVAWKGKQYLVPTDAKLVREDDVEVEAIPVDFLLARLPAHTANVVMLDACREAPFLLASPLGVRKGAKRPDWTKRARYRTLVASSASSGQVAYDGSGANSPYAIALLRNLQPNIEIRKVFRRIYDEFVNAAPPGADAELVQRPDYQDQLGDIDVIL